MTKRKPSAKITRNERGFHIYGVEGLRCSYGTEVRVYESSSAEGPHVWLGLDMSSWHTKPDNCRAAAHLTPKQAREVIRRLQTWLNEVPKRWGGGAP